MHVVEVNRGVRPRTFHSLCSFAAIFMLCISVCIILSISDKDTELNIKYGKDKWTYSKNDVRGTVSPTDKLLTNKFITFLEDHPVIFIFILVIIGHAFLMLLWLIWKLYRTYRRIEPAENEPVVHYRNNGVRSNAWNALEYSSDEEYTSES